MEERRKLRDEKKLRHRNAANLLLSVKEKIIKETKKRLEEKERARGINLLNKSSSDGEEKERKPSRSAILITCT